MTSFYAYIYYDPSRNNEPIYVGKGSGYRAWKHLRAKHMHPFAQRLQCMKRNGTMPVIGLYSGLDEDLALLLEIELIAKFGRKDLGKGSLLNLTDGGEGQSGRRFTHTAATRKKLGESQAGRPKSIDHRRKLSEAGKGRAGTQLGKKQEKVTCPHCNTVGGAYTMPRWHFDNCKFLVNI